MCAVMTVTDLVEIKATVRVDAYRVLSEAVENGVAYGYMRAHKHADNPQEGHLRDEIFAGVMLELCEVLRFDDE